MNFIRSIINTIRKSRAVVFVDYEYWYYSYRNQFYLQPNISKWLDELRLNYNIFDVRIFVDFDSPGLNDERKKLNSVDASIFDTREESAYRKKDMTDFVMLDAIYQCAEYERSIDTYILFTGDGHFHSVVKYLVEKKKKKVIVFGVLDSVSKRLQADATECFYLPYPRERFAVYQKMIIENFAYVSDKVDIIPTFKGTVDAVARKYNVNPDYIQEALSEMIELGYVNKKDHYFDFQKSVKTLIPNWEKFIARIVESRRPDGCVEYLV